VGDLVNLNRYRKQRQRAEVAKQASENRVSFGRDKAERARNRMEQDRHSNSLDGKRFDDARPDEPE
jgi:Domain of unknown function (DUF4169)